LKLHDAAAVGDLTKMRKLVAEGAILEYKASDGMRPIHRACHSGQVEAIKVLVELGADKEAKTFDGGSPLHCAADHGHVEAVREQPPPPRNRFRQRVEP
jgi:cytohesin